MAFIGGTAKFMRENPDGALCYKMTKANGDIFYAKTYQRDSIDGQTLQNDPGWEQIDDAGGKHCYQHGVPFDSDPEAYTKTALDLTDKPKVVEVPKIKTLTPEELSLYIGILNLAYTADWEPEKCVAEATSLASTMKLTK